MAEFRDWYRENTGRDKKFTYVRDWGGFNIPSDTLLPFQRGDFGELSRHEALMQRLAEFLGDRFYLIGTSGGGVESLEHELAHGLWATNPSYRDEVTRAMASMKTTGIRRRLKATGGYHPSVYEDETQAYLITDLSGLFSKTKDAAIIQRHKKDSVRLRRIFDKYRAF